MIPKITSHARIKVVCGEQVLQELVSSGSFFLDIYGE